MKPHSLTTLGGPLGEADAVITAAQARSVALMAGEARETTAEVGGVAS